MISKISDIDYEVFYLIRITYLDILDGKNLLPTCVYIKDIKEGYPAHSTSSSPSLMFEFVKTRDGARKYNSETGDVVLKYLKQMSEYIGILIGTKQDIKIELVKRVEIGFDDEYPQTSFKENPSTDTFIRIEPVSQKPILIEHWDHLREVNPQSNTHRLVMDEYSAWIHGDDEENSHDHHYLSTHTFYGSTHENSTYMLQKCGFNVEIDNWDKESENRNSRSLLVTGLGKSGTGVSSIVSNIQDITVLFDKYLPKYGDDAIQYTTNTPSFMTTKKKGHPYDAVKKHRRGRK